MKRIVIAFALMIVSLAAFGQAIDRDVLLAGDGALYTVESFFATQADTQIRSTRYLSLTIQKGTETQKQIVPTTAIGGSHLEPSLAYDNETKTLFIFWEAARSGALATDLAFVWYRDGVWGKVTTLDGADWDARTNLRIALTRKTETTGKDGLPTSLPEITVHAVWWQSGGMTEWARYAMITLDHDDVIVDNVQNLTDFVPANAKFVDVPSQREILRHPAVFESSTHDTVDVVFGDPRTDKMHRVTLKPVLQGRVRITIGKTKEIPTPTATINSVGNVSAISTGADDIAYYFATSDSMKYMIYKNGAWSNVRSIALGDRLNADGAVNALRRMLSSE